MGRNGRFITYQGRRITVTELVNISGKKYSTVLWRINNGWGPERIVQTPLVPVEDRCYLRKSNPRSGRYSWLSAGESFQTLYRKILMAKAKRGNAEAIAELKGMGLLCWGELANGKERMIL